MTERLLAAFSKVYCENQKHKAELKDFENLQPGQKSACKSGAKKVVLVKEIIVSEEMLSTSHRVDRKDRVRLIPGIGKSYRI